MCRSDIDHSILVNLEALDSQIAAIRAKVLEGGVGTGALNSMLYSETLNLGDILVAWGTGDEDFFA